MSENHPKIKEAAIEATRKYGTGCAGSRFLNGTLDIHENLEKRLAAFVGKDEALIFSTGFQVNLGVVSCLTGREDYIILDESDHASIIEGRRLSFSKTLKFKHNDMESLEKVLKTCQPDKIKLIVVDGVFSMEGDVAPLPQIVELAKKYNANIMVDEAHGIGVFGKHGEGVCTALGVTKDVDLIMGTFSKSFASLGGFIACDKETGQLLASSCTFVYFQRQRYACSHRCRQCRFGHHAQRTRTHQSFVGCYRICLERFPSDGLRNRSHIHPDYSFVYPRQRKNFRHHPLLARQWHFRQSGGIACRCSQRHADSFFSDGYAYTRTG